MWTSKHLLLAAAATIGAAHAQSSFSGDLTSYTLSSTMSGNCNFMAAPSGASQNYAAINAAQWDSTKNCGRCAEVSCSDSRCTDKSKTEIVYIVDQCPECKSGDLDVSPSVFKSLTGSDPSRYKVSWRFVDCPVTGNLKYCLKEGSNPYFTAIQPANSAAGIKSMTINSQPTSMVASAFYYLLEGNNINLSSIKVSVTSMSGQVVTDTVSLTAGSCTTGKSQFTSSGSPVSPAVTPAPTTKTPVATTAPSTPVTKAPTTPATKTPTTPATQTPTTPATQTPSTPATKTPSTPATQTPSTPTTKTPSTPATQTPSTPATTTETPSSAGGDDESPSTTPGDDDYSDSDSPTTAPATKTPKTKKPKKTKTPKTKKPSKNADKAAGEASTPASTSPKTKKPVSCRRLAD